MKKNIIIPILVVLFFLTGFIGQSETFADSELNPINNPTEIIMRGILYNGEVIPMINLPVVEITGDVENRNDMVKAIYENGEIFPLIELDEVVITPNT